MARVVVLDIRDIPADFLVNVLVEPCHHVAELRHKIRMAAERSKMDTRLFLPWLGLFFATAKEERSRGLVPRNDKLTELVKSGLDKLRAVLFCK